MFLSAARDAIILGSARTSVVAASAIVSVVASASVGSLCSLNRKLALEDFALVDPNLNADNAVSCVCSCYAVVDVSTESLKRDCTLVIALGTSDLGTAQTASYHGLDTLSAGLHGSADNGLHSTSEGNTALELLRDVLCNELSVHIGVLYLDDLDVYLLAGELLHLSLELVNLCALSADNHTGLCAGDADSYLIAGSLDLDRGNASLVKLLLQKLTDLIVFNECITEGCLAREPARIPILDYTHSETMWINLLSHCYSPPYSASLTTSTMLDVLLRIL